MQGIPYRAAVSAVAHPATPDPRISRRSCFGPSVADLEVVVERERLVVVVPLFNLRC